ncbi:MAG: DUF952 domain-containing protein [Streptosporangiales bacterium]|nr:DUF952 domain-containing protein [Streptosporangiales bacterium]
MSEPLFHLAFRSDWAVARETGRYEISTRGQTLAEVGFIHCALRHQVRGVADAFYADADDLVPLVVDQEQLDAPVVHEPPAPGLPDFPHLYGALPVAAVTDVLPVGRAADGNWQLPV